MQCRQGGEGWSDFSFALMLTMKPGTGPKSAGHHEHLRSAYTTDRSILTPSVDFAA